MKTYIIKDTDLMINGSIVPEGSKIELNDEDAKSLSPYLTLHGDNVVQPVIVQEKKKVKTERTK
ncbi:MAG: hypothetical protein IPM56_11050 [Ignavibacteriales bacterium]|nr:MAG: hypothetical protein IPM56_11050 [Ignavibacteriales bacterium]